MYRQNSDCRGRLDGHRSPNLPACFVGPSPTGELLGKGSALIIPAHAGSKPMPVGLVAMLYDERHGALLIGVPVQAGRIASPLASTDGVDVPVGAFALPTT